jgi:hypothetical protein
MKLVKVLRGQNEEFLMYFNALFLWVVRYVQFRLSFKCFVRSHYSNTFGEETSASRNMNFVTPFICAEIFKGFPPNQHDKTPVSLGYGAM